MKINEVEAQLGITKANIRFYEKQGLLSPRRNENGYRDYSESDIARLKNIIILRKLHIPVQQIQDLLDGVLPLQIALEENISALQKEIGELNGSLALCRQLKEENADTLDTGRYWQLIQEKEQQGWTFSSIAKDYLTFAAPAFEVLYWFPLGEVLEHPRKVVTYLAYILFFYLGCTGIGCLITGDPFFAQFLQLIRPRVFGILLLSVILIPIFFLSKKDLKKAESMRDWVPIIWVTLAFVLSFVVLAFYAVYLAQETGGT